MVAAEIPTHNLHAASYCSRLARFLPPPTPQCSVVAYSLETDEDTMRGNSKTAVESLQLRSFSKDTSGSLSASHSSCCL